VNSVINITAHCDVDDRYRVESVFLTSIFSLEVVAMDTPLEVTAMKKGYLAIEHNPQAQSRTFAQLHTTFNLVNALAAAVHNVSKIKNFFKEVQVRVT